MLWGVALVELEVVDPEPDVVVPFASVAVPVMGLAVTPVLFMHRFE